MTKRHSIHLFALPTGCTVLVAFVGSVEFAQATLSAQNRPDFNNDGFADIAIGVSRERVGSAANAGAAAIMYGGAGGVSYAASQLLHQNRPGVAERAETGDRFGAALAWGDFDNDGFDDIAIGVPNESVGSVANAGAVHVQYGSNALLTPAGEQLWHQAKPSIPNAPHNGDGFGSALASGDFNGDGFDDLAIGVPRERVNGFTSAGMVHVLYGSAAGLRGSGNQVFHQDTVNILGAAGNGDRFGSALAAGDFNSDGFADLAIGSPFDNIQARIDSGAVNVIYGSGSGLAAAGNRQWHQTLLGSAVTEPFDRFGEVVTAGDFNGDGFDDLAISATGETVGSARNAGGVSVMYGSASGLVAAGSQSFTGQNTAGAVNQKGSSFGDALAAGDINGDGFDELVIGAPLWDFIISTEEPFQCPPLGPDFLNTGRVTVVLGTVAGLDRLTGTGWTIEATTALSFACGQLFGSSVSVFDHNNDGFDDLIIGGPGLSFSGDEGGIVFMFGDVFGLEPEAGLTWSPSGIGDGSANGPMGDSLLKR